MNTFLKVVEYIMDHPAVILAAGGTFWEWVRRKNDRASRVLAIASDVYFAIEGLSVRNPNSDKSKWERFVSLLIDSMKANGLGEPSGKEMRGIKKWIENKADGDHR